MLAGRFFLTAFCSAVSPGEAERCCLVLLSPPRHTKTWPLLLSLPYRGAAPLKARETTWQQTQDQSQKANLPQILLISSADGLMQDGAGVNTNDHLHVCKNHLHGAALLLKPCQAGSSNAERRAEMSELKDWACINHFTSSFSNAIKSSLSK